MSGPKPDSINRPSRCLKPYENDEIFHLIGRRCVVSLMWFSVNDTQYFAKLCEFNKLACPLCDFQTLATSVAQLYIAPPESRNRWKKKLTGVICFVKDSNKHSYFLRMYSLAVSLTRFNQLHVMISFEQFPLT